MRKHTLDASRTALALAGLVLALTGCGKVSEIAGEKAAEKMMEAQINQNGGNAKVDLTKGGVTAEGTDENGKAFKMEMGSAQLTEADVKIPFYPGAKPSDNSGTRIKNGGSEMMSIELHSSDSTKTVSTWYRDKLKAGGEGKMVFDSSTEDNGMSLSINDSKAHENVMVNVSADGDGSRITLIRSMEDKPAAGN